MIAGRGSGEKQDGAGASDLSQGKLPTAEELRGIRLRIFAELTGEEGREIPAKLRHRLEREPLMVHPSESGERQWSERYYSLAALYFDPKALRSNCAPSAAVTITRLAINRALQELQFSGEEKKEILKLWNSDEYFAEKLVNGIEVIRNSILKKSWEERYFEVILGDISFALGMGAIKRGEVQDSFFLASKARQFWHTLERIAGGFFKPVVMAETAGESKARVTVEPGFEKFCAALPPSNLSSYIEGARTRGSFKASRFLGKELQLTYSIRIRCNQGQRVKLTAPYGEDLAVVSKRVFPRKSAFADREFEVSKLVYSWGIPTDAPVAEIRESTNRYFLWRKLEAIAPNRDEVESVARQKKISSSSLNNAASNI